MAFLGQLG